MPQVTLTILHGFTGVVRAEGWTRVMVLLDPGWLLLAIHLAALWFGDFEGLDVYGQ